MITKSIIVKIGSIIVSLLGTLIILLGTNTIKLHGIISHNETVYQPSTVQATYHYSTEGIHLNEKINITPLNELSTQTPVKIAFPSTDEIMTSFTTNNKIPTINNNINFLSTLESDIPASTKTSTMTTNEPNIISSTTESHISIPASTKTSTMTTNEPNIISSTTESHISIPENIRSSDEILYKSIDINFPTINTDFIKNSNLRIAVYNIKNLFNDDIVNQNKIKTCLFDSRSEYKNMLQKDKIFTPRPMVINTEMKQDIKNSYYWCNNALNIITDSNSQIENIMEFSDNTFQHLIHLFKTGNDIFYNIQIILQNNNMHVKSFKYVDHYNKQINEQIGIIFGKLMNTKEIIKANEYIIKKLNKYLNKNFNSESDKNQNTKGLMTIINHIKISFDKSSEIFYDFNDIYKELIKTVHFTNSFFNIIAVYKNDICKETSCNEMFFNSTPFIEQLSVVNEHINVVSNEISLKRLNVEEGCAIQSKTCNTSGKHYNSALDFFENYGFEAKNKYIEICDVISKLPKYENTDSGEYNLNYFIFGEKLMCQYLKITKNSETPVEFTIIKELSFDFSDVLRENKNFNIKTFLENFLKYSKHNVLH